jgi:DNA-binding transcriptional LysR family regulator
MDLLETRELVYFVAVAEELHFGRAALRVGVAQPALSRAIARLERRLGVPLLARTSRRVTLTAAGEVLLREGIRALEAVDGAARRTRRAGAATRLVLVAKLGTAPVASILAAFRADPAVVPVDVVHDGEQRVAMLRDGRADVALLHRPHNDLTGLRTLDLHTEPLVAVLAPGHRLAGRAAVHRSDLAGEPVARWPESAAAGGPDRPLVRDVGQLTRLITGGGAIALLPESAVGQVPRALPCIPVTDAEPTTSVLAWSPDNHSDALAAFLVHARAHRATAA